MNKAILFFIIVVIYKVLSNTYCFFRIKYLSQKHLEWFSDKAPNFPTYKKEVISLFKKAGIKNISTPAIQPMGYNRVASFNADIFTNFPCTHPDIFNGAIRMFYEAEGAYRQRILEAFSPMYWVDSIIFAPRKLLDYLGLDENKLFFKACNILMTIIWWMTVFFISFYRGKINDIVTVLFGQFNK